MTVFGIPWFILAWLVGAIVFGLVLRMALHFRKRPLDHTSTLSNTWNHKSFDDPWH